MSQVRQLSLNEVCSLQEFIEGCSILHDRTKENPLVRWSILIHRARLNLRTKKETGIYGLFIANKLSIIMAILYWQQLPYYLIDNLRSIAFDIKAVLEISEFIVRQMESKNLFTFFYSRSLLSRSKESKRYSPILANYIYQRYDIVIEKYMGFNNQYSALKDMALEDTAAVYRCSLKNEFRFNRVYPYTL